jgi:polysaccharide export outer membrane protein
MSRFVVPIFWIFLAGAIFAQEQPPATQSVYVIGVDDVLNVNIWHEPDLSRAVVVRPDGRITLPLIGDVQAAGLKPSELEQSLRAKLTAYMADPQASVMVQEARSQKYNVLGEVLRPGTFPLKDKTTVLDAIANAGGFRDFAKVKKIYVLRNRPDGQTEKLRFNYKEVAGGRRPEQNVVLAHGDTVVIP